MNNLPRFIAFSGKCYSGKTTAVKIAHDIMQKKHATTYNIVHFITPLKEFVGSICGIDKNTILTDDVKNVYVDPFKLTVGQMFQQISAVLKENFDEWIWIKAMMNLSNKGDYYIIGDMRTKNEYSCVEYMRKRNKVITIRINGDPVGLRKLNLSRRNLNDPTETDLDDATFDYVIENTGSLEELRIKLQNILK